MWIKIKVLFLSIVVFSLLSCFTTTHFDPVSEGFDLSEPIDQEVLVKSIRISLANYNWIILDDEPGYINARYTKSEGIIVADIRIEYNEMGYVISYVDSKNIDANLRRSVIHKNYVRWINNLNKTIYTKYIELI